MSNFIITFPTTQPLLTDSECNVNTESVKNKLVIKSALIIDDEMDICLLLKNYFIRKNTKVFYSTTLKDGLSKFSELKPDLLILDHNLPDGCGIAYIDKFKKLNGSPYIIIISAMSNLRSMALAQGADCFMEKPISFIKFNELLK